jgi:hypothetical protein
LDQLRYRRSRWLFAGLPRWQRRVAILLSLAFALFVLGGILLMILLLVWNPTT